VPSREREGPEAGVHPTLIDVGEATSALPRALTPMRPRLARRAFNSPEYIFELKWDGIRALVARDATGLRVTDRGGGDLLPAVPELRELRLPEGTVLDGEIVVCDSRGRPSYDLLAGRLGPKAAKRGRGPIFVAFDLLYADGRPLIARPLAERRARLLGAGLGSRILAVPEHLDDDGEPFLEVVAEYGLEGIVAKKRDGRYVPGTRTADWLKCHVTPRADVVVGGLVSYGPHLPDAYRQIGVYAGRIIAGAKPSSLPVIQPTKFELVINLQRAKRLRLAITDKLHALADEVIE